MKENVTRQGPDPAKAFRAIAMILSARDDAVKVNLVRIKEVGQEKTEKDRVAG